MTKLASFLSVAILAIGTFTVGNAAQLRSQARHNQEKSSVKFETESAETEEQIGVQKKHQQQIETVGALRGRLAPSVWAVPVSHADSNDKASKHAEIADFVAEFLSPEEVEESSRMCSNILYKSIKNSLRIKQSLSERISAPSSFDAGSSWHSDAVVELGTYIGRMNTEPLLRMIVEGTIRRRAVAIIEDPYSDIYETVPINEKKERWPSSIFAESIELEQPSISTSPTSGDFQPDAGARYLIELYDFYMVAAAKDLSKAGMFLDESIIFDAVLLIIETWIKEQQPILTQTQSQQTEENQRDVSVGTSSAAAGTDKGMIRSSSDERSTYEYSLPSNILAATALERIIELNRRIWQSDELHEKASKLLCEIEFGIQTYGIISVDGGEKVYALKVGDKYDEIVFAHDEASLLLILSTRTLGWSKYDTDVHRATVRHFAGTMPETRSFRGSTETINDPTYRSFAMSVEAIEALVSNNESFSAKQIAEYIYAQLKTSLSTASATEERHSRRLHEWSNALFVTLVETGLGIKCDNVDFLPLVVDDGSDGDEKDDDPFTIRTPNMHKKYYASKFNLGRHQSFYQELITWDTLFRTV